MGQTRCQLGGSHQERLRGMSWLVAPVRSFLNPERHPWVRTWPDPTAETGRDLGVLLRRWGQGPGPFSMAPSLSRSQQLRAGSWGGQAEE